MESQEYNGTPERRPGTADVDVIVIGGGLAGLAAASYLGRAGKSVMLFEKSATGGGRAISQEHAGFLLNLGAHALYEGSPATQALKELGVKYTGGTPIGVRAASNGKTYLAPADTASLLRTRLLGPSAKWEAGRLMIKLLMANPDSLATISLSEWLDNEVRHPEVKRVMETSARVTTYTNAPDRLSLGHFADQLQVVTKGKVVYADGGWQTLVNGLEKTARRGGTRIVTGARVESVTVSSGRAAGVRLADGTTYRADAVVLAIGPHEAAQLVGRDEAPALEQWAASATPVKAACLDIALKRLPEPTNKVVFGLEQPLFLTTQSEFSDVTVNQQDAKGALVYTLKYLDPFAPQDPAADRQELEEWLDQLQPGWRAEVIESRYLPHLVVSNALVEASSGGLAGRPGPSVPKVDNLYVAGDWVGPKGALASAALWSAREAASSILGTAGKSRILVEAA